MTYHDKLAVGVKHRHAARIFPECERKRRRSGNKMRNISHQRPYNKIIIFVAVCANSKGRISGLKSSGIAKIRYGQTARLDLHERKTLLRIDLGQLCRNALVGSNYK